MVDVTQANHGDALVSRRALVPECLLRRGRPLFSPGTYVGDLLVMGKIKKHCGKDLNTGGDVELVRRARDAYEQVGWPRAAAKSYAAQLRLKLGA